MTNAVADAITLRFDRPVRQVSDMSRLSSIRFSGMVQDANKEPPMGKSGN
jgi:hypothetical protein